MHLVEINIGQLKYPVGDPRIADFVDNLGKINAVAERMPGFVWRLVGDDGHGGALLGIPGAGDGSRSLLPGSFRRRCLF